ncbi:MAG: ABC transporter ATP-binding protein [Crocinitomicaceae bacterium]|nr:ABC transporter ATP-binding protein [Crocinitomicaceae bacterium]MDG2465554.1 ABC transporter ATP-binding protein [Crocinitomicaceae bacterium]
MKNFFELYRYTFKYKLLAILTIVFNLLYVIFNLISFALFIPFLQLIFNPERDVVMPSKPIYDGGFVDFFSYCTDYYNYFMESMVASDPKKALLFVCISVFVAFFLKNLSRYGAIWHQSQLRMATVRDVRNAMYSKILRLPLSYYTDERKGDLVSRVNNDVGQIEIGVIAILELVFREPIAILLHIALLIYWSPQLTLISFVLLPISALVISRIGKSLKRTAKQEMEEFGAMNSHLDETLGGVRIIKAFNAAKQVRGNFEKTNLRHQQFTTKTFRKRDLSSPLNETLGAAIMLCIAWFGGKMILDSTVGSGLTGEEFIGFIIVFSQLLRPIQGVASSIAYIQKSSISQDRINDILNSDEKIFEAEDPQSLDDIKTGISLKNVTFKYKDVDVIKNVSFEIPKGKKIALVGESGSGKSTLADLVARFYDIEIGEISYDGIPVDQLKTDDLRKHIGIVSQESILFNDTVANNIAFGMGNPKREDVISAAKIANAHEFISQLDNGYDTNIGERGNKLSGGQKQRVSIARAIFKNPSLLILDEATSALDTESEVLVQEALEHLLDGRTSLVIAHRLSTIRNADNIIVLSKGKISETGTHDELMQLRGIYYKLSSMQGIND